MTNGGERGTDLGQEWKKLKRNKNKRQKEERERRAFPSLLFCFVIIARATNVASQPSFMFAAILFIFYLMYTMKNNQQWVKWRERGA